MLEIEQKFRVDDLEALRRRVIDTLQVESETTCHQTDQYFNHPTRDFGKSDEALRVRRVRLGDETDIQTVLTYKGPKERLGKHARKFKTRREIELPIGNPGSKVSAIAELLQAVGFEPSDPITKMRRILSTHFQGYRVEIALDHVHGLGEFAELEILAPRDEVEEAQEAITALCERLQLTQPITNSYRTMLFAKR